MDNKISIPAHRVIQPIGEFFVASIEAKKLVDISYSDVRSLQGDFERYLGIQRPLNMRRVKDIRNYLLDNKDATFPTSIIIAVDEKCVEYDERKNRLYMYPYIPDHLDDEEIPYQKIAKVLDGQHRIAGFFEGNIEDKVFSYDKDFYFNVSIFVGIDLPEQAKIFATVNLAQTKVNKSLVYDLEGLAKKRSPYKTCHHIAVALDTNNDSPFYKRIKRLGVATPGRSFEPLTQASFVESLVKFLSDSPERDRNYILDGKSLEPVNLTKHPFAKLFRKGENGDVEIYQIIYNYFHAVKEKWPNAWSATDKKGNLLPKSNAFKALMRYLKDSAYIEIVGDNIGEVPTISQFSKVFEHMNLSDEDFTTKNFIPGSGGQSAFYKVLTGQMDTIELFDE